jgi:hypothetical protein
MMISETVSEIRFSRAAGATGRLATWQCTHSMGSVAVNGKTPVSIS